MMRPGVLAVGPDRGQRRTLGNRYRRRHIRPAHVGAERMAGGQHAKRLTVIRVDCVAFSSSACATKIILTRYAPVVDSARITRSHASMLLGGLRREWNFSAA